ncbi:MAG: hypothetical protein Q7T54_02625 [Candidatus Levybacteria bacterium]|nr:hypothetical protein [Candidatus Levybacteria bacterium]
MRKVAKASAPGKIHLIGEHSSVYGKPAILLAINRRVVVSVEREGSLKNLPKGKTQGAVESIQKYLHRVHKIPVEKVGIIIGSDIPVGKGLGSSAALSAALSAAFHKLYKIPFTLGSVFEAAYESERFFHGNPSGGDLAASVYGGVLWFRKETESLKLSQRIELSAKICPEFIVIDSGKPIESTKEMVSLVSKMKKKKVSAFCEEQEIVAKNLSTALIQGNKEVISRCISEAQTNLDKIGVVGSVAKNIILELKNSGVFAKISGGGGIKKGSGIIVAGISNKRKVEALCERKKWDYFYVKIENEGVRLEVI